uniref:Uncharacterized protein n=1 Tax=Anguilla anguilla TaxID=7936 RepID=A0A0E9R5V4_ANGAN
MCNCFFYIFLVISLLYYISVLFLLHCHWGDCIGTIGILVIIRSFIDKSKRILLLVIQT